ncbi:FG-GAP repeat protein, partial [Candidatus Woesearchaeota archaeon]|nr:FG-GAP repeat protein [Candidatus Woesearchaeota archaeon]
ADNLKKDVGEIYIKHGSETLSGTLNLATENPDATIFGIDENEYSGVSLVLCDINGDGNKDLVLTVPYSEGKKNGDSTYGEAWAVFGPIAAGERDLAVDRPNTIFYGKGGVRGFPNKVTCGNLNNDKRNGNILEDLILSSPQETADVGEDDAGRLYILNGRAAWPTVFDLDKEDASTIIKGEFIGDGYSGSGLASGDIDDDGFMDIITAAFLHDADGKVDTGKVYVSLSPVIAHFQKPAGTTCWTWADENNDGSNDAFDICHDYIPTLNASDYYRFVLGQWGRADAVYCCKPIDAEPGGDYVKFRDKGQDGQPAPDPNKSYAWLFIGVVNDENGNPKEQSRGERCEPDGTCEERSPPSNACDPQPPCP